MFYAGDYADIADEKRDHIPQALSSLPEKPMRVPRGGMFYAGDYADIADDEASRRVLVGTPISITTASTESGSSDGEVDATRTDQSELEAEQAKLLEKLACKLQAELEAGADLPPRSKKRGLRAKLSKPWKKTRYVCYRVVGTRLEKVESWWECRGKDMAKRVGKVLGKACLAVFFCGLLIILIPVVEVFAFWISSSLDIM